LSHAALPLPVIACSSAVRHRVVPWTSKAPVHGHWPEKNQLSLCRQTASTHRLRSIAGDEIRELASFSIRLIRKSATTLAVFEALENAGCCWVTLCVFLTAAIHALLEEQQSLKSKEGKRRPAKTMWRFLLPASEEICRKLPSKAIALAAEIQADSEGILGSPCGIPINALTIYEGGRKYHLSDAEIDIAALCDLMRRYAKVRKLIFQYQSKRFPHGGGKNSTVTQANFVRYIRTKTKTHSYFKAAQLINGVWRTDQGNSSAQIVSPETLRKNFERQLDRKRGRKASSEDSYDMILRRCDSSMKTSSLSA
jgi:hypothetical protein